MAELAPEQAPKLAVPASIEHSTHRAAHRR